MIRYSGIPVSWDGTASVKLSLRAIDGQLNRLRRAQRKNSVYFLSSGALRRWPALHLFGDHVERASQFHYLVSGSPRIFRTRVEFFHLHGVTYWNFGDGNVNGAVFVAQSFYPVFATDRGQT